MAVIGRLVAGVFAAGIHFVVSWCVLFGVMFGLCYPKSWEEFSRAGFWSMLFIGGCYLTFVAWRRAAGAEDLRGWVRTVIALTAATALGWLGGGLFAAILATPIWILMGAATARQLLAYLGWIPVGIGASVIHNMVEGVWLRGE